MQAKKWYESKTLGFALLTILIGVAAAFGFAEFEPDPQTAGLIQAAITIIVALVNSLLRLITEKRIEL